VGPAGPQFVNEGERRSERGRILSKRREMKS